MKVIINLRIYNMLNDILKEHLIQYLGHNYGTICSFTQNEMKK